MFIKVFPAQPIYNDELDCMVYGSQKERFMMIASEYVSEYFVSWLNGKDGNLIPVLRLEMASGNNIEFFVEDQSEETIRDLEQNNIYTNIVEEV